MRPIGETMSRFLRLKGWLLAAACVAGPLTDAQAQGRRDARVIQQGTSIAAFTGDDAGQRGTGLRLTSLGRWRDERNVERFTIWRLRNSGATPRTIQIEAPGTDFSVAFALPARSETILRSPVIGGPATHRLLEGAVQVDVKAAGTQWWSDGSIIAPVAGNNRAPVFLSMPPVLADVGQAYRYPAIVFDADNDAVLLSALSAPTAYQFDASAGAFRFQPTTQLLGVHAIQLKADDGRGGIARQDYELRVLNDFCPIYPIAVPDARLAVLNPPATVANLPRGTGAGNFSWATWAGSPSAPTLAASLVPPGDSWRYVEPDDAADREPNVGDWLQGAPGNMNSSAVNATLERLRSRDIVLPTWAETRGNGNNLDYRIARFARVRMTTWALTGQGSVSFEFLGWADCHNDPPSATDLLVTTTAGQPVAIGLLGVDADGDPLTFEITVGPTHGELSGTPPALTFNPAAGFTGTDRFFYTVADGGRISEPARVEITVTPSTTNRPPVASPATLSTDEDTALAVPLQATDPDGDALGFRIVREPARGTLSGTPPNLVYQPRANLSGDDEFFFRASDSVLESPSARVVIQVRAVNDPPVALAVVAITDEDTPVDLRLLAEDVDSPSLAFRIVTPPARGTLAGTPPNPSYRPAQDFHGDDQFTCVADDGGVESSPAVARITVRPKNDAPRITSIPGIDVTIGSEYRYDVDATDIDGDVLAYVLVRSPPGMVIDQATGVIRWMPPADEAYPVEVIVDAIDPAGLFAKQRFLLAPTMQNRPPVFQTTPQRVAQVGTAYVYDATATDPDGDPVSYALSDAPSGMTVSAASGAITWTPLPAQAGTRTAILYARDGRGGEATQQIAIEVRVPNRPPVITSTAPTTAIIGAVYGYVAVASDPDGDTMFWTLVVAPEGMSIDAATGAIRWTPAPARLGAHSVELRVDDGQGAVDSQLFQVDVRQANRAPRIVTAPDTVASQGTPFTYDIDAVDPDGDPLDYALAIGPTTANVDRQSGLTTWLPDSSLEQSVERVDLTCRREPVRPGATPFAPILKWSWSRLRALSMPLVAPLRDTNGDGTFDGRDSPVVLINTTLGSIDSSAGTLVALDGATGSELWENATAATRASSTPAIGDIDGDGDPEIVAFGQDGHVLAFDHLGQRVFRSAVSAVAYNLFNYSGIGLYDIDGDGRSEILAQASVFNSDGTLRWRAPVEPWNRSLTYAVDLDGDGSSEVIIGPHVYSASGALQWSIPGEWVLTSVGNMDGDTNPEIVAVVTGSSAPTAIRVLNHDGSEVWSRTVPAMRRGGPPVIADLDGDFRPDVSFIGMNLHVAYSHVGDLLWANTIRDVSTGTNGSTAFDFDGDGEFEVVSQDQDRLRVFDGRSGRTVFEAIHTSPTAAESPIVADVDNDGHADLVVEGEADDRASVAVYMDVQNRWVATRPLWNQYNYHVDNVTDALRIPPPGERGWLTHNSYRVNRLPGREALGLADLAAFDLQLVTGPAHAFSVRIVNRGLAPSTATRVAVYSHEDSVVVEIASVAVPPLDPGAQVVLNATPVAPLRNDALNLSAEVDPGALVVECNDANNRTAAVRFRVRAADTAGLADQQDFAIRVAHRPDAPLITTSALPEARISLRYRSRVLASDPDIGDALTFQLLAGPPGMQIDRITGEVDWLPSSAQMGSHTVRVRVADISGLEATATYPLRLAMNRPPVIESMPLTVVMVGEYRYPAVASDPDGDTLSFALTVAPGGMTVSTADGVVAWNPTLAEVGSHPVTIRVQDEFGAEATQAFVLVVRLPNAAPRIESPVPSVASVGLALNFLARATDPDGDTLAWSLSAAPAGMAIDPATGAVTWTPVASQVGVQTVTLRVSDGRGGVDSLSSTINVTERPANQRPVISSVPPTVGKVGRQYRYVPAASDPDGDPLVWTLSSGAPGAVIDASTGELRFTPASAVRYPFAIRVADADGYAEQAWSVDVVSASAPLSADVAIAPPIVAPGGEVTITVAVMGAGGPVSTTATMTPPGITLPLDADGVTVIVAPTSFGCRTLAVTVGDEVDQVTRSAQFCVADPNDTTAPEVRLLAPADDAEVTAPSPVRGSATDANLASWILAVRPANSPTAQPTILAQGATPFTDQQIATFDPTLLMNGLYTLILQATDASGNVSSDSVVLRVTGDMKVGHFALTFEDVSIPLAGIPIRVTRTYDTRQRNEPLDFGYGWSVDYQNVRIRESAKAGFSWRNFQPIPGPFGQWCSRSNGARVVTVTLPDGEVESFRAKAEPECTELVPEVNVQLVYEPIDGTDSRLEQTDYGLVRLATIAGSGVYNIVDPDSPNEPVDPRNYRLTTPEGVVYELDQNFGVRRVVEPGGQSLTYSASGIQHSSGVGVQFVRDANGRIDDIVLPDGEVLSYTYTPAGDLESFADPLAQVTTFRYGLAAFPHYLSEIIDPRGVRAIRNEYDDSGRLVATIDADGHRIEYTHDIAGRREQVRDRRGNLMTYVYDDEGRVLSESNALGETTLRTYDADGNTLSETNPLGQSTTSTYDVRGNRLTETNALGETTTSTFDARNNLLTQVDSAGRAVMTNIYRPNSSFLSQTRDALGNTTVFGYDLGIGTGQTGELTRMTDAANQATVFELDQANRGWRVAEVDALGNRTTSAHDAMGRVATETRTRTVGGASESLVNRYTYDDKGRVTRTEQPDGSATTTEYGPIDKPVRECDALGRCMQMAYDNRGNPSRTTYPDGTYEEAGYDANGNLVSQRDRGGRITRMVYDAANRLVETIHPDADADDGNDANNPRSRNVYDAAGQLVETIDENGQVTTYGYDRAGRRTQTTLAQVNGTTAVVVDAYDTVGRRQSSTDANGHVTLYRYDAAGRLLETDHEGAIARIEYDATGRKLADTDPTGRVTRHAYDTLGRLVAVVLANPTSGANPALVNGASPDAGTLTTRYAYDEVGNKTHQTDAEGRVTRWEYDAMGRETARVLPEGQRETKQYNAAGELIAHTDFNGRTTRYTYDVTGKPITIDYPTDADVGFVFNAVGERTRVTDGRGASTMTYDRRGRTTQSRDADGGLIEYTYDAAGNLLSRVSPSQSLVYTHDARHRLETVTRTVDGEMPTITRYEYDQDGNRTAMRGGDGIRTEYSYDRRHRLTNLVKRTAAGTLLLAMQYTVDASGMRTAVEESDATGPVRAVAYAYDATKRLTQEAIDHRENASDRVTTWTYDPVGNRLSQALTVGGTNESTSYTYDANDRLLNETRSGGAGAGTTAYTYDANGNTLTKTSPTGTTTYVYNDANRLTQATTPQGTTAYVYTADGLRVRQTHTPTNGTATTTWYVQDSAYPYAQVIEEYISQGAGPKSLAATFTFADDLVSQTRYESGSPVTRFVQQDGFGSTRWLTDATGAITDTIDFDAFGVEIGRTGSTDIEHLYRGEAFDEQLGLYYLRARWMDPASGRFTQMDTFQGFEQSPATLHKFNYAEGDPVNRIDPSGHLSMIEIGVGISAGTILGLTAQTVVGGLYNSHVSADGRPTHYYETNQIQVCSAASPRCTPENVYQAMLRMPAPAHIDPDFGAPFENGQEVYAGWLVFPGGMVVLRRFDDQLTHVNQTTKVHLLHNGKITRTAQQGMGGVTIKTVGQGDNHTAFIALANERVGKATFESLDRTIKAWLESGR